MSAAFLPELFRKAARDDLLLTSTGDGYPCHSDEWEILKCLGLLGSSCRML